MDRYANIYVDPAQGRSILPSTGAILLGVPARRTDGYGYGYGYAHAADDPAATHKRVHLKQRRQRGLSGRGASGRRAERLHRPRAPEQELFEQPDPVPVTRAEIRNAQPPTRRSRSRSDEAADQEFDPYEGYRPERDRP